MEDERPKEGEQWTAPEVLSWFNKEFSEEEILEFLNQIPTEEGRELFKTYPSHGKDYILVLHNLGSQKRSELQKYVAAHSKTQGGIHNLATWFGVYEDIMKEKV